MSELLGPLDLLLETTDLNVESMQIVGLRLYPIYPEQMKAQGPQICEVRFPYRDARSLTEGVEAKLWMDQSGISVHRQDLQTTQCKPSR